MVKSRSSQDRAAGQSRHSGRTTCRLDASCRAPVAMDETEDSAGRLAAEADRGRRSGGGSIQRLSNEGIALLVVVCRCTSTSRRRGDISAMPSSRSRRLLFLRVEKAVLGALICGIPWSGVGNARPYSHATARRGQARFQRMRPCPAVRSDR